MEHARSEPPAGAGSFNGRLPERHAVWRSYRTCRLRTWDVEVPHQNQSYLRCRGVSLRYGVVRRHSVENPAMRCTNCGNPMRTTRGRHRYTESGLPNVTLVNVDIRSCPRCGEREIVIPQIAKLHEMIARFVIRSASSPLAPELIRFLRKWLGLSSADFALYMGVRPETVSRWENRDAAYPLSPTADRLLRLLVANHGPVEQYPVDLLKN